MAKSWLLKTEPSTYSFADLEAEARTVWDGVKNALALKHLAAVRAGDEILIYHTGGEKAVVGIARASSDPYPDPKAKDSKLWVVDVEAVEPLPAPVPLASIKKNAKLRDFPLVRLPRLSVMPVSTAERAEIDQMSKNE